MEDNWIFKHNLQFWPEVDKTNQNICLYITVSKGVIWVCDYLSIARIKTDPY